MGISTFEELVDYCLQNNKTIYETTQEIEAEQGEISVNEVRDKVKQHLDAMKMSIEVGKKSNEKAISNWCGDDCEKVQEYYKSSRALFGVLFQKIITYSLATIEENLRMGKIVACPTAGSCGIVPSVIVAISEEQDITEDAQIDALITAGMIGAIISNKVQLAGAVAGCQAHCSADEQRNYHACKGHRPRKHHIGLRNYLERPEIYKDGRSALAAFLHGCFLSRV